VITLHVESSADKTVSESAVALQASIPSKPRGKAIYTCPMHPEVQQEYPGDCPKCGMALELKTVTVGTDDEENVELLDMTKRFWIGAALALPVFVLAMTHLIPALARPWVDSSPSRWLQFALATPVVLWAGWLLLRRVDGFSQQRMSIKSRLSYVMCPLKCEPPIPACRLALTAAK
jgi:cation transport ATPase